MDVIKVHVIVLFVLLDCYGSGQCDCTISMTKDFGNPQPIFVLNNSLLSSPVDGVVRINQGEGLTAACPGNGRFVQLLNKTMNYNSIQIKCISNQTFKIGNWIVNFKNITCNAPPWFTVDTTNDICFGGNNIVRIGYNLTSGFYKLYEACFDANILQTHYVKHTLTPSIAHRQNGGRRPNFIGTSLFRNTRINDLYKLKSQMESFSNLLGYNVNEIGINEKQYLNRGHLAPRADFALSSSQRATFHYVNVAPQWKRANTGDWAALEQALRDRVVLYQRPVTVYTGVHNITTVADRNGVSRDLYLNADENNNNVVPVPLYFYKLVYEPQEKLSTIFISINNPFYNEEETKKFIFCNDVCDGNTRFSWLKWRHNDNTTSFCCNYKEFAKEIKHLPKLHVKGLFY